MSVYDLFAIIIASLTLSCSVMVVLSRNAVYAALYLLLTLVGIAAEYALLNAHFLAIIQILVYAGAVVALIVFVLMMMGFGREQIRGFKLTPGAIILPFLLLTSLVAVGGIGLIRGEPLKIKVSEVGEKRTTNIGKNGNIEKTSNTKMAGEFGTIQTVGYNLVTNHVLSFELISLILLMAIGGILAIFTAYPQEKTEKDSSLKKAGDEVV